MLEYFLRVKDVSTRNSGADVAQQATSLYAAQLKRAVNLVVRGNYRLLRRVVDPLLILLLAQLPELLHDLIPMCRFELYIKK